MNYEIQTDSLASFLNGREYGGEITKQEASQANKDGLVVAFGYSDDNLELRGAITDEEGAYDGGEWKIGPDGLLAEKAEDDDEMTLGECREYIAKEKTALNTIKAEWLTGTPSWRISIDCPHSTFNVMEGDEVFCIGIVFAIADLKRP